MTRYLECSDGRPRRRKNIFMGIQHAREDIGARSLHTYDCVLKAAPSSVITSIEFLRPAFLHVKASVCHVGVAVKCDLWNVALSQLPDDILK